MEEGWEERFASLRKHGYLILHAVTAKALIFEL